MKMITTVKDLIDVLSDTNPDARVVMLNADVLYNEHKTCWSDVDLDIHVGQDGEVVFLECQ